MTPTRASAAPLSDPWSASAAGNAAAVDLDVVAGISLANARLSHSASDSGSGNSPRSRSRASDIAAAIGPLGLAVNSNTEDAPPDNPPGAVTGNLAAAAALGIGVQALTTSNEAHWDTDTQCVAASSPLADTTTSTAGVDVAPAGVTTILGTGVATVRGVTSLPSTGGNGLNRAVRSETTGSIAGVSVLGGLVQVGVAGDAVLTAQADGTTGGADANYTAPTVTVTGPGIGTVNVAVGANQNVALPLIGSVNVAVNDAVTTEDPDGLSATASVKVVTLTIQVGSPIPLATATIDLLPLTASASAPSGGIDCQPQAPTLVNPADGSTTNDNTPTYSGTGMAGATINLTIDGAPALPAVATVDGSGDWSYTPVATLPEGPHTVSATQTVGGQTSPATTTHNFVIDTTAPAPPVVVDPADGAVITDQTPNVTGTAEADTDIEVFIDGNSVGTTTSNGSGAWQLTSSSLSDGPHTVYAVATDAAGNDSSQSNTNNFTIDSTPPSAPVVVNPANGSSTNDTTPDVTGTAEPNVAIEVFIDGNSAGTTNADGTGAWQLTAPTLLQGPHTVYAVASDQAGNDSVQSNTNTFTVDTDAPAAPVVVTPADGSTVGPTPTIAGTGEAGASLQIFVDGAPLTTTTVNGAGNWGITSTTLAAGPHTVYAIATDAAGNASPQSNTNNFTVDATAPAAPTITSPADGSTINNPFPTITGTGEPGALVTVTMDGGLFVPALVDGSGNWSTPWPLLLSNGPHTVTATQSDPAGNVSPQASSTFTVDTLPPAPPVIVNPANGSTINDSTPTISGTGEPGATLNLALDAVPYAPVVVDGSGNWSVPVTTPLAEGPHLAVAIQSDPAGNPSVPGISTFILDLTAPAAPVITSPADGATVNDNTPTISGTCEIGATVVAKVDGNAIGSPIPCPAGIWSVDVPGPGLGDGPHTVTATQTDPAGNVSPEASNDFTVDTAVPAAPVIVSPANGSSINDSTPTISGTGEPGATLTLVLDAVPYTPVVVDGSGNWSVPVTTPLGEGPHIAVATQADPAGNPSVPAVSIFDVDLTAPAAPVISSPADGSTVSDNTPTISGTCAVGATVVVKVDGNALGSPIPCPAGTWEVPGPGLTDGPHTVTATQTDPAGNVSPEASNDFTVDTTAPAAPAITSPADGAVVNDGTPTVSGTCEVGTTVVVEVDGNAISGSPFDCTAGTWSGDSPSLTDGPHTVTAVQTDAAGNASPEASNDFTVDTVAPVAPVIVSPANGSTINDSTPTISGTGEPGATLNLAVDGTPYAPVVVDGSGNWSVPVTTPLAEGPHVVAAIQTDPAGNGSAPALSTFTLDLTAPVAPVISSPADGATVSDNTPTISGTCEVGATVVVKVDGNAIGSPIPCPAGTWSVDVPGPGLGDGPHTVTATQTDPAGNESPAASNDFTVDTTAPAAPVINSPADGAVVNDSTPAVSGTCEVGATVVVEVDGNAISGSPFDCTAGTWSGTSPALSDGPHTVTAVQTDDAGNESQQASNDFTVDTTAPAPPVITSPEDGDETGDLPVIEGTAEPGSTVTVSIDGSEVCTDVADGSGNWSCTPSEPLAPGEHEITAVATDPAGNVSEPSEPVNITVRAIVSPVITTPVQDSVLNIDRPTIAGTGEPGSSISVRYLSTPTGSLSADRVLALAADPGESVGTTTADTNGDWSMVVPEALDPGAYTVQATQVVTDFAPRLSNEQRFRIVIADDNNPGDDDDDGDSNDSDNSDGSGNGKLASTGGPSIVIGGLAVMLMLAGSGLAAAGRRRRGGHS